MMPVCVPACPQTACHNGLKPSFVYPHRPYPLESLVHCICAKHFSKLHIRCCMSWASFVRHNLFVYSVEDGPFNLPSSFSVPLYIDHMRSGEVYNNFARFRLSEDNFRKPWRRKSIFAHASLYLSLIYMTYNVFGGTLNLAHIYPWSTGQVRIWRSLGQGWSHRSKKLENFYSRNGTFGRPVL